MSCAHALRTSEVRKSCAHLMALYEKRQLEKSARTEYRPGKNCPRRTLSSSLILRE
jgi:hypothetical protein